ncbi:MAG: hypothetical protein AAGA76_15885 [Pseudomonadota bacterium]
MAILGNIGNGFGKLLRTRERQAQLSVHAYLAQFDDATLARLGMKREELKTGGSVNHFI